jgi:hypothetical protein
MYTSDVMLYDFCPRCYFINNMHCMGRYHRMCRTFYTGNSGPFPCAVGYGMIPETS